MYSLPALDTIVLRMARLGYTDIYHDNVRKRGIAGQLFIMLFGTPHLGNFANGFYLRAAIRGRTGGRILDAGCGDGTFVFYLAQRLRNASVVGVDIGEQGLHTTDTTLDICARIENRLAMPNVDFRQMNLLDLNESETFDFVYSFDVLEHIAENRKVLVNIYRALAPGGQFLLRIPNRTQKRILSPTFTAEHAKWAEIEHLGQHYDMNSLLQDLRELGYHIDDARFTMGFWGRLSFELSEALRYYRLPQALQFAAIPVLKAFRLIDVFSNPREGDGLLVLCSKQPRS